MTPGVGLILGILLILILCVIRGIWLSNRKHDGEMCFTLECPCGSVDFTEKETFYICKDCATKISK